MTEHAARPSLGETEIYRLVYDYIGVEGGYLKEFTYAIHKEFYPRFCGFTIDVPAERKKYGTTKKAFEGILRDVIPEKQARIVEGIFKFLPLDKFPEPDRAAKASA